MDARLQTTIDGDFPVSIVSVPNGPKHSAWVDELVKIIDQAMPDIAEAEAARIVDMLEDEKECFALAATAQAPNRDGLLEIYGFLVYRWMTSVQIGAVAVVPGYQRHGIGTLLIETVYDIVRAAPVHHVVSMALGYRETAALHFLSACGFRADASRDDHIRMFWEPIRFKNQIARKK